MECTRRVICPTDLVKYLFPFAGYFVGSEPIEWVRNEHSVQNDAADFGGDGIVFIYQPQGGLMLLLNGGKPTSSIVETAFVEPPFQGRVLCRSAAVFLVPAASDFSLDGPNKRLARDGAQRPDIALGGLRLWKSMVTI
jgi:hypothetical protein